jgi:hypothetical protein
MAPTWVKSVSVALTCLALIMPSPVAHARVDASPGYSKAQTYSGALRYVRVDLGYEVVEKDPDAAYLIFKYVPSGGGKASIVTGTLEVVDTGGSVRLFVSLPRMPEYHERVFRDGLLKKLREEYGAPPPLPKKPAEKPAPDKAPGAAPGAAPEAP